MCNGSSTSNCSLLCVCTLLCTGTKHWLPKEVIVQMNASSDNDSTDSESTDSESTDNGSTNSGSTNSEPIDSVPNIKYKKSGDIQVSIVKIFIILLYTNTKYLFCSISYILVLSTSYVNVAFMQRKRYIDLFISCMLTFPSFSWIYNMDKKDKESHA